LIRSTCQKPIDEFFDVKINGDFYHLRVLEDSYGPMRIVLSQSNGTDGRDQGFACSEEDSEEEEEGRRRRSRKWRKSRRGKGRIY
jgi:hypothetical protein